MSYSLFEGFVSGQVPDQTTKYGCIESVVAIVMGCFATHFCTSHCIWYTRTLTLHFRMCTRFASYPVGQVVDKDQGFKGIGSKFRLITQLSAQEQSSGQMLS